MIRRRNYKAQNERIETGVLVKSHKEREVSVERRMERMLSVESNWSVQEETHAVSATGVIVNNKHSRPFLLERRRHRLTGENPRKRFLAPGENVLLEGNVRMRARISSKELLRIRHVIDGILPRVKKTNMYRDATSATNVCSDLYNWVASGIKSRRPILQGHMAPRTNSGEKGSTARNYSNV